jgi:hypothetical protein
MLKVELCEDIGIGVIIPMKTNLVFSNQTGGNACLHPEIEGIYIPLISWKEGLKDPFFNVWATKYDKKLVETFLKEFGLFETLEPFSPPPLEEDTEAWVWAKIRKNINKLPEANWSLRPFAGLPCVVTYPNSD